MVLYTAFKGKTNSSKILLDSIQVEEDNKLYLTNSFETSVKELLNKLKKSKVDFIVSFGQLKLPKNVIRIELRGIKDKIYTTHYDYKKLQEKLLSKGYKVEISSRTNYLCDNIYYHG